jgi:hypothetical protein
VTTAGAKEQVEALRSLKSTAHTFRAGDDRFGPRAVVRGDRNAKTEHLRVALSYSPRNNVLLFNLAITLEELGRHRDAAEVTRAAIESGWQFPKLFPLWGVVAIESGELKGLRQTLEAALDVKPPSPYLYGLLEALSIYDGDRVVARPIQHGISSKSRRTFVVPARTKNLFASIKHSRSTHGKTRIIRARSHSCKPRRMLIPAIESFACSLPGHLHRRAIVRPPPAITSPSETLCAINSMRST